MSASELDLRLNQAEIKLARMDERVKGHDIAIQSIQAYPSELKEHYKQTFKDFTTITLPAMLKDAADKAVKESQLAQIELRLWRWFGPASFMFSIYLIMGGKLPWS